MSINRRAFWRKTFVDECLKFPGTAATSPTLKCCRGIYPSLENLLDNLDFIPSNKIFAHFPENPHKCIRLNRACMTWCSLVRSYRIF
jgi:hypothetical protein